MYFTRALEIGAFISPFTDERTAAQRGSVAQGHRAGGLLCGDQTQAASLWNWCLLLSALGMLDCIESCKNPAHYSHKTDK